MRKGLTLVELAIVLVILALVIGGVLVGRSFIRASEIRAIQSDVTKYAIAINMFTTKMGKLPGDLGNATLYWSTATNGDNDGTIDYQVGFGGEEYEVWQQLALAELISGTYTGDTTSIPVSTLATGFYRVSYQTNVYGKSAHMISLNAMNPTYSVAHLAVLSPKDVYAMDKKSDDGRADEGSIMGFNEEGVPGCVTNDYTVGSGDYLYTSISKKCKVFFELQ